MFSSIEEILEDVKQGIPVIVVDDEARENEGDVVIAAEKVTPESINFMIKEARGLVCVPLSRERIKQLHLDRGLLEGDNKDYFKTCWRASCDAASGITTGISAFDRARTIKVLVNPNSKPSDLVKPGHVFTLEAKEGGVLVRAGHTEAAVDLARLAGFSAAGVICEIIKDDGTMARLPDLMEFARKHKLKICTIASLIEYRRRTEKLIRLVERVRLSTYYGEFDLYLYECLVDKGECIALVKGKINKEQPVLVRVHSQCITGDVFLSKRCDCGWQLQEALRMISREGGVLLYMQQEGRGVGLKNKIRAYRLQDEGYDTVEANEMLGFPPDLRDYGMGAQILVDLGVRKIRLITNNPRKIIGLEGYGLKIVERLPLKTEYTQENKKYLLTKQKKLDHIF